MLTQKNPRKSDSGSKQSPELLRRRALRRRVAAAVAIIAIAVAALAVDGIRRERRELTATLAEFTGQVEVLKGGTIPLAPTPELALANKDVIITGAASKATVVFPDGSAILVEPNTHFTIRLLEFARGWRRDRSFMVTYGSVVSHVSRFFGAKSEQTICTPTAVAAVRGTGFRVAHEPDGRITTLQVAHGKVEFTCGGGTSFCNAGETVTAHGHHVGPVKAMRAGPLASLKAVLNDLEHSGAPSPWLQNFEYRLLGALNTGLQSAGIARAGRDPDALDAARRKACRASLDRLQSYMETMPANSVPDHVNLATLEGLGLDPEERDLILDGFAGHMLGGYEKEGEGFTVTATAGDSDGTVFTQTGQFAPATPPQVNRKPKLKPGHGTKSGGRAAGKPHASAVNTRSARGHMSEQPKQEPRHGKGRGKGGGGAGGKGKPLPVGRTLAPNQSETPLDIVLTDNTAVNAPVISGNQEPAGIAGPGAEVAGSAPTSPTSAVAGITEAVGTPPITVPSAPTVEATPGIPSAPAPPVSGGGVGDLAGITAAAVAATAATAAIAANHGGSPDLPPPAQPVPEPSGAVALIALIGGAAAARKVIGPRSEKVRRKRTQEDPGNGGNPSYRDR